MSYYDLIGTAILRPKTEVMVVLLYPMPLPEIQVSSLRVDYLEGPIKTLILAVVLPGKLYKALDNLTPLELLRVGNNRA